MELIAGPVLGYNIEDLNETLASSQEVIPGRLSFSDGLNNFNEKFKFRTEMYQNVLKTVKLENLKENPRFYADRSKVILAHKIPGPLHQSEIHNTTNPIFEVDTSAAKLRERELSPEFFTPRDSAMSSQHRRIDSKTLKKLLGHSSTTNKEVGKEHAKKVSEDLKRIEGALARIEKREEMSKSELISPGMKVPTKEFVKPNSRKSSLTQSRNLQALSRSKSPKPASPQNGRDTSPGFVIAKPQGSTQIKKRTSTTPTREIATKKSTSGMQVKKIQSSNDPKKPSISSQVSNPLSARGAKTKSIPSLNVVLDQNKSSQQISRNMDETRVHPQTARYTQKKFWKEAERPRSKSPKSSTLTNENRQRIDSVNNLAKTLHKGPKTPSSPLANEYVKYINTTLNQSQVDNNIPVKTFDFTTRKISTPQITDNNMMRADSDEPIVMNLNLTAPEFSKPQSIKEIGNRGGNFGPLVVESRDTNDFSNEEDEIQPIEATLDLSAYIANTLTYPDDRTLQEKQNLNPPLMSERSYDRGGKGAIINSIRPVDFRNNDGPEWGNVQISKKIESETKPKSSVYTRNEMKDRSREENEDYGDNLMGENFDENTYLEEIRKKMAKISSKNENSFDRVEISSRGGYSNRGEAKEIFKKEPSKNFEAYPEDIETKENMSYRSNVQTMPNSARNKIEDSNYVRKINFGSHPVQY